jgi:hypothetical protein
LATVDRRGPCQHRVDRRRNKFDVAKFFGRDAGHEIEEGAGALTIAEVERLERVVQER